MEKSEINKEKKVNTMGYKVTIGIMAAIIAVLLWLLMYSKEETKKAEQEREEIRTDLTYELDSLMIEHTTVKEEYGELTEQAFKKDSIILANAEEIKLLLAKTSDYKRIKRKLYQLRKIQQSYVDQLDSLYTENRKLKENLSVAEKEITRKTTETQILTQEKNQLAKIVKSNSGLKAYNVKGTTYTLRGKSNREVETLKARRVDRVKISFTISENPLAKPGPRDIYIRIARPDGLILCKGKGDEYSFDANGTRLQYSLKKKIEYKNKAINMVLDWDKKSESAAMEGNYHIAIYLEGRLVGQSRFTLE